MSFILYDLVHTVNGTASFSPHPWKARCSLLHKGVPFETRPITYADLQGWVKAKTGIERPRAPFLELPDGTYLFDSFAIAEYLEAHYPEAPSIFLPASKLPVDAGAWETGRAFALVAAQDRNWMSMFQLGLRSLTAKFACKDSQDYFTSEAFLGSKDAWQNMVDAPRGPVIAAGRSYLAAFVSLLSTPGASGSVPLFLTSPTHPGFTDYALYGRFSHCVCGGDSDAIGLWTETPQLKAWTERMTALYGGQLVKHHI